MAKRIHWDEGGSAGENARAQLPAIAGAYFKAGRKALRTAKTPPELHAFRLATKRWRYTLELFRACYGPSFEQRVEALKEVQTLLGDINDCAAGKRLAQSSLPGRSSHRRQVEQFLDARAVRLATEFRKHWREKFDADGQEDWWVGYLARKRSR